MSAFYILCEIINIVFALSKGNVQHKFSLWSIFKPVGWKFQVLNFSCVQQINDLASIYAISGETIRLSMLNFVSRIFFLVVHGILLSLSVISFGQTTRGRTLDITDLWFNRKLPQALFTQSARWLTIKEYWDC